MKVKCFECDALIEAEDTDAVVAAFVVHGEQIHTWSYPETRFGTTRATTPRRPSGSLEARNDCLRSVTSQCIR